MTSGKDVFVLDQAATGLQVKPDHRVHNAHVVCTARCRVRLLYQYFHPCDVVSARVFADLAEGLAQRGWEVIAQPSNRTWNADGGALPRRESWKGVDVRRVWRPGWKQNKVAGRLFNAAWMLGAWSLRGAFSAAPSVSRAPRTNDTGGASAQTHVRQQNERVTEIVVVGSDPIMSSVVAFAWRLRGRRRKLVHWCFDLYPDAAIADGLLKERSWTARSLQRLAQSAYRRFDVIADLGPCMRRRLERHLSTRLAGSNSRRPLHATITPWGLVEPPEVPAADARVREELFGQAKLGLLYSGSFGRAHASEAFLALARRVRERGIVFCFAGRGNRMEQLRAALRPDDTNVRFAGFTSQDGLEKRLTACDLHLVSLQSSWTGAVVPSKFFGALAVGRGVVFAGSAESAIAHWIRAYDVGMVAEPSSLDRVADDLVALADDPQRQRELGRRCHDIYQIHFSRDHMIERWDKTLLGLVGGVEEVVDPGGPLERQSSQTECVPSREPIRPLARSTSSEPVTRRFFHPPTLPVQ